MPAVSIDTENMKQDDQIAKIKQSIPSAAAPLYLLMGEEPFFIDSLTEFLEDHLLPEEDRAFNQTVLYGPSTSVAEIRDTAARFPMGAERQTVIVREAQALDAKIDQLLPYVASPAASTVLVLCYKGKNMDRRKAVYKEIAKKGVVFESPRVYESEIPTFIKEQLARYGISLTGKAMLMLAESLGTDLSRIASEARKLSIVLPAGTELRPETVEKYIGISRNFNNFEFQKAIANRDAAKALQIAEYFATSKDSNPLSSIAVLFGFFSKLIVYHNLADRSTGAVAAALGVNPYFVRDYTQAALQYNLRQSVRAVEVLREADLKAKGVDAGDISPEDIYKELIFKLLSL